MTPGVSKGLPNYMYMYVAEKNPRLHPLPPHTHSDTCQYIIMVQCAIAWCLAIDVISDNLEL